MTIAKKLQLKVLKNAKHIRHKLPRPLNHPNNQNWTSYAYKSIDNKTSNWVFSLSSIHTPDIPSELHDLGRVVKVTVDVCRDVFLWVVHVELHEADGTHLAVVMLDMLRYLVFRSPGRKLMVANWARLQRILRPMMNTREVTIASVIDWNYFKINMVPVYKSVYTCTSVGLWKNMPSLLQRL